MDKNKYKIERRYINKRPNVRPGTRLASGTPGFFVAHDTGNPGANAEAHFKYFNNLVGREASAHTFIDDKRILEIIPTGTSHDKAEKAWHVRYNVTTDNDLFGDDANDIALGVELCYGGKINYEEAYKRFVWYLAFCCDKWGKNPYIFIPTHRQLDPSRKQDCDQALMFGQKTLKQFYSDVAAELKQAPQQAPKADFVPLPVRIAQALIDNYVSPLWFAEHKEGDEEGKTHAHNLANNLRLVAGIPLAPGQNALPVQKLPKSNAQEIIFRWLSPAWHKAHREGDPLRKQHFNNLANYLRLAAGIPEQ